MTGALFRRKVKLSVSDTVRQLILRKSGGLCLADWQPGPLCQYFTTRPRFGGVFVFPNKNGDPKVAVRDAISCLNTGQLPFLQALAQLLY
jgi:hypothetical protein